MPQKICLIAYLLLNVERRTFQPHLVQEISSVGVCVCAGRIRICIYIIASRYAGPAINEYIIICYRVHTLK